MAEDIVAYSLAKHPERHRERIGLAAILYGLFTAPIVWAVDLMVTYGVIGHACYPGQHPLGEPPAGLGLVRPLVFLCHLAAFVLIASGTVVAYRMWRVTGPPHGHHHHLIERGEGRTRYLGIVGMGFGAMFLLLTATEALSLALVGLCFY
ncbi:MAG: hypothetical protein JO258_02450 [Alphaproteobacteria bacterium]|nr:hypothetical protein [Alphaproteobacteria bacterium]